LERQRARQLTIDPLDVAVEAALVVQLGEHPQQMGTSDSGGLMGWGMAASDQQSNLAQPLHLANGVS
jgi:hypothetical protein